MWRPWEEKKVDSDAFVADKVDYNKKTSDTANDKRTRANVGEKEKNFIIQCYNFSSGKEWKDILHLTKSRVVDAGLPERIVQIYLESSDQRAISRMKNIVRQSLKSPSTSAASSKPIDEKNAEAELVQQKMRYATKRTPAQRKLEHKLSNDFAASSTDSESEMQPTRKQRKSDKETMKEAQEAHKAMCTKAMDTLDRVNSLLAKTEEQINKKNLC